LQILYYDCTLIVLRLYSDCIAIVFRLQPFQTLAHCHRHPLSLFSHDAIYRELRSNRAAKVNMQFVLKRNEKRVSPRCGGRPRTPAFEDDFLSLGAQCIWRAWAANAWLSCSSLPVRWKEFLLVVLLAQGAGVNLVPQAVIH
jgi:hypothetical protein